MLTIELSPEEVELLIELLRSVLEPLSDEERACEALADKLSQVIAPC
jgi:hypothetical protein